MIIKKIKNNLNNITLLKNWMNHIFFYLIIVLGDKKDQPPWTFGFFEESFIYWIYLEKFLINKNEKISQKWRQLTPPTIYSMVEIAIIIIRKWLIFYIIYNKYFFIYILKQKSIYKTLFWLINNYRRSRI